MKYKKSAKDLAFDRERAGYRKRINELERTIKDNESVMYDMREKLAESERQIAELNDWVERLLTYTEMSKDDLQKLIAKKKKEYDVLSDLDNFMKAFSYFRTGYGVGNMEDIR